MMEKKVTWLELFYDLLFVAAVSKAGHVLLHAEHGIIPYDYLLKFVLIFIPVWWAWVGQTMFINRYGQDILAHRVFLILQLLSVLVMTASLSVDFDQYYLPFFIGYIGSRAFTAIQYFLLHGFKSDHHLNAARFLGLSFLIGIAISSFSLFFDSWVRYLILYAGIAVDIILPLIGRRRLVKVPIHTHHLMERFALFTIILLGESVVSMIAVLQLDRWNLESILFIAFTAVFVIAMWWQYFDNVEKNVSKEIRTSGQAMIYGHLFIYISMSMIAASIQLLYLNKLNYGFMLAFAFGSLLLYFASTALVFHQYKHAHLRMRPLQLAILLAIVGVSIVVDLVYHVPNYVVMGENMIFFLAYAKLTA